MTVRIFLCITILFIASCTHAPTHYQQLQKTATLNKPRTVALNIITEKAKKDIVFVASGFFITQNLIVTNNHVIEENTKEIWVLWDKSLHLAPVRATVIAKDQQHDLAILKTMRTVAVEPFSLARNSVQLGQAIGILGFPEATQVSDFSVKHLHFFQGIVASIIDNSPKGERLVLDCKVLQGNSGGPVVDLVTQEVVGVVSEMIIESDEESKSFDGILRTYSVEGESLGLAIPIKFVHQLLRESQ